MGKVDNHIKGRPEYAVSVDVEIKSKQNLKYLSAPTHFELHPVELLNEGQFRSQKLSFKAPDTKFLTKDLIFYFQSKEVEEPSLFIQKSIKHPD